jgi:hypothetical protein
LEISDKHFRQLIQSQFVDRAILIPVPSTGT